jgi:FSR family fosmidomycin resistance protein-like MFS transporter
LAVYRKRDTTLRQQHGHVSRNRSIALLSVGHACVDVYQGAVAALVPFFIAERAYAYAAASGVVLAASLLSSVAQPLFGVLTDRWAMPWLIPVSTVLGGVGIALSGVSGDYLLTLIFVAVSGVGVAAYHPESARLARVASEGNHAAMSWFVLGGNFGFATSPLLVASAMAMGGLRFTPVLVLPALVGSLLCLPVIRALQQRIADTKGGKAKRGIDDKVSFLKLCLAIACRSIAFIGLSTFISLYAQQRVPGGTAVGTAALFVLYLGGAVGTVVGGSLAQRWDRVRVVRWSYALTAFAVAGVVFVTGPALFVFVALASAGFYIPFSLQTTLGQDYLPTRIGTASGVTLGLTMSVGGLASPVLGRIADVSTLQIALAPLIVLPALAWMLFLTLREPQPPESLTNRPGSQTTGQENRPNVVAGAVPGNLPESAT